MKTAITIFCFTKILMVSEGHDFRMEQRKLIDSTGTIEIVDKVRMINDTIAVQRKYNTVYYYFNLKR